MFNFFKLYFFCISVCLCNSLYSATVDKSNHDFANMPCEALMVGLISESSYNQTFSDKNLALVFGFERQDNRIGITFSHKVKGRKNNGVYANFELDLLNNRLMYIDRSPSIEIKINKDYVPFIAEKCTPDDNVYVNTASIPDNEFDGQDLDPHENYA